MAPVKEPFESSAGGLFRQAGYGAGQGKRMWGVNADRRMERAADEHEDEEP